MTAAEARIERIDRDPPADWDERVIDPPGGHVLQGTTWAAHRASMGWTPHFVGFADGRASLVLTRRQPPLPGFVAYAPRGPIGAGDPPGDVAARVVALGDWVGAQGGTIFAADPELDADPAYEAALRARGFADIEEIQPSRHRLVLAFRDGDDAEPVLARVAKGTRQRIRAAEKAGTTVEEDPDGTQLEAFGGLIDAAAERKRFTFSAEGGFTRWWHAALEAGIARFWVARNDGRLVGGLIAYRQGGHLATAFSADRADLRRELPGTMHLVRWTAIQAALEAGHPSIDLGGVDVRGARHLPRKGEPTYGLWEHKASFGADWVESAAAHELVLRPWVYRAGLVAGRLRRAARAARGRAGA